MSEKLTAAREAAAEKLSRYLGECDALRSQHGEDDSTWPAGILERYNRLVVAAERAAVEYDAVSERFDKMAAVRSAVESGSARLENGFGGFDGFGGTLISGQSANASRAWDGLDRRGTVDNFGEDEMRSRALIACAEMGDLAPDSRTKLTDMVTEDTSAGASKFVLALGNPAYRTAFDRWLRSPQTAHYAMTPEEGAAWRDVEAVRGAMNETGASALLPLVLDPAIVITNAGSAGNIRQYAKIRTTVSNSYRGVTSAGITAEIKGEGVEAADASPSVAGVDVPVYLADASVTVSYEIFQDTTVASQLGELFADARANLENRVFISGAGTTEPFGALTRISATTGSRVAPTTAGTFTIASYPDVFKVRDALPARHRNAGHAAWISNIAIQSIVQQVGIANAGLNGFWANLGDAPGGTLLGFPSLESTSMTGTVGANALILALIDWSQYVIVDRLGTAVQMTNVQGSNNRSTGQWEFFAYWRNGGDLLNYNAGRVLKL